MTVKNYVLISFVYHNVSAVLGPILFIILINGLFNLKLYMLKSFLKQMIELLYLLSMKIITIYLTFPLDF